MTGFKKLDILLATISMIFAIYYPNWNFQKPDLKILALMTAITCTINVRLNYKAKEDNTPL